MSMLPFFLFFFLVIIGHYFAWRLLSGAWPVLKRKKFLNILCLSLVTIIFLTSFILLNAYNYSWLAIIYTMFAILFGLLTQLMLFGALFYTREFILKIWPFARRNCVFPDPKSVARLFLFLVGLMFLLGSYNAFFPKVKTIILPAFNEELKGKTFVHLSDLHLGAIYRPAWQQMIAKKVNRLEVDFIIISGDLFDGSDRELSEFIEPLSAFEAEAIFVPGNHDSYILNTEVEETVRESGLIYLSDRALELSGIELIAFNYLSNQDSNLRRDIKDLKTEQTKPRIVVNHVPVDQAEAESLGANLMLMGHAHRGQIFPFSIVTRLIYGRFAYGLSSYHNMTTYTSAGTATWGPPLRTLFPGEIVLFKFE